MVYSQGCLRNCFLWTLPARPEVMKGGCVGYAELGSMLGCMGGDTGSRREATANDVGILEVPDTGYAENVGEEEDGDIQHTG